VGDAPARAFAGVGRHGRCRSIGHLQLDQGGGGVQVSDKEQAFINEVKKAAGLA
jgi:hypothetical protein